MTYNRPVGGDTVLRAVTMMLFAVAGAWAAWVSNTTLVISDRQTKVETQMEQINYKLDLLLEWHQLNPHPKAQDR